MPPRAPAFRPALVGLEERATPAATPIGTPDPSLNSTGTLVTDLGGGTDHFNAVVAQPDGKLVAAGTNGVDVVVERFLPNGTPDATYGAAGREVIDFGGTDEAFALVLDPGGRAVVAGGTSAGAGGGDLAVARLTPAGALDPSFGSGGKRTIDINGGLDVAYAVALDATGRVVLGGGSSGDLAAARLDAGGNLDPTFGTNGTQFVNLGATEQARAVFVQPDGRIVLAGSTTLSDPVSGVNQDFVAVRLDANAKGVEVGFGNKALTVNGTTFGVLDLDFGGVDTLYGGAADAAGRYYLVGATSANNDFAVARLNPDFTPDGSFGTGGKATVDFGGVDVGRAVAPQANGGVVVAGYSSASGANSFAAARLTPAGALDPAFGTGGKTLVPVGTDARAHGAAGLPNGGVVLVGTSGPDAAVVKLAGTAAAAGVNSTLLTSGNPNGTVRVFAPANGTGAEAVGATFAAFPGVPTAARVVAADVTGDGTPDYIVGAGPGSAPQVAIYDGKTGGLLASFLAFEGTFTGGLFVAAGDFNGDGKADVVVTPDVGGGPRVRLFDGAALSVGQVKPLADFLGIDDPNFRGGVRPAVGDFNADGTPDLAVAAGIGGGPRVAVFDGKTLAPGGTPTRLAPDFFAFESTLRNGAFVAAGDVTGDGKADLIFGGGPGGGPRVRVVDGGALLANGQVTALDATPQVQVANFFAGDPNTRGGVRVAAKDVDGSGRAGVVTGSGDGLESSVQVYKPATVLAANAGVNPAADQQFDPFSAAPANGVFVG